MYFINTHSGIFKKQSEIWHCSFLYCYVWHNCCKLCYLFQLCMSLIGSSSEKQHWPTKKRRGFASGNFKERVIRPVRGATFRATKSCSSAQPRGRGKGDARHGIVVRKRRQLFWFLMSVSVTRSYCIAAVVVLLWLNCIVRVCNTTTNSN